MRTSRPSARVGLTCGALFPLLLSFSSNTGSAQVDFEASLSIRTRSAAHYTVGDFDGDGHDDIAYLDPAVAARDNIQVLYGDGDGGFGGQITLNAGLDSRQSPQDLGCGDLNGDGRSDLVVTIDGVGPDSHRIRFLLASSEGGFGELFDSGFNTPHPGSVTTGDFDQDGNTDIVFARTFTNQLDQVSIIFGNGHGAFPSIRQFDVGEDPHSVLTANLDGNAFPDLVVLSATSATVLLIGPGGLNTLTSTFLDGLDPRSAIVGDFNEDDNIDLAISISNKIVMLLNQGDGTLVNAFIDAPVQSNGLGAADINTDGHLDVLTVGASGNLILFLGDGEGNLTRMPSLLTIGESSHLILTRDLDEDGHSDALIAGSAAVNLLRGNGLGGFLTPRRFDHPGIVVADDLDLDGHQDIVTASANFIDVQLGRGDLTFQDAQSFDAPVLTTPGDFVLGEFTGDLFPDAALLQRDSLTIFQGKEPTKTLPWRFEALPAMNLSVAGRALVVLDVDEDTNADLAVLRDDDDLMILRGNGSGGFTQDIPIALFGNAHAQLQTGDINNDDHADIVAVTEIGGKQAISTLLGDGSGHFLIALTPLPDPLHAFRIADWDNDGNSDLGTETEGGVRIFLGNGTGTFTPSPDEYPTGSTAEEIHGEDFNLDGLLDIALKSDHLVTVLLQTETGGFLPKRSFGFLSSSSSSMALADFDEDGRTDVASGNVTVLRNSSLDHFDARAGNVNAAGGEITDVLFINGSQGQGNERLFTTSRDTEITITLAEPPSRSGLSARHAIYLTRGTPAQKLREILPFNLGTMAISTPLNGGNPDAIWSTLGRPAILGQATLPSSRAPTTLLQQTIGRRFSFFVQGLIIDPLSPQGQVGVTNGIYVILE